MSALSLTNSIAIGHSSPSTTSNNMAHSPHDAKSKSPFADLLKIDTTANTYENDLQDRMLAYSTRSPFPQSTPSSIGSGTYSTPLNNNDEGSPQLRLYHGLFGNPSVSRSPSTSSFLCDEQNLPILSQLSRDGNLG